MAEQSSSAPQQLWTDGVEDYLQYARQLLADYKDVLPPLGNGDDAQKQQPQLQQQQQPEAAPTLFGAAAAGSAKPPSLAPGSLFGSAAGTAGTSGTAAAAPPSSIFGSLTAAPGAGGGTATGASMFNLGGGALGQASAGAPFGGFGAGSAANSGSALFAVPSTGTLGGSSINTGGGGGEGEDGEEGEEEEAGPSVRLLSEVRWMAGFACAARCLMPLLSWPPSAAIASSCRRCCRSSWRRARAPRCWPSSAPSCSP